LGALRGSPAGHCGLGSEEFVTNLSIIEIATETVSLCSARYYRRETSVRAAKEICIVDRSYR
jgi:hypothetical protein